MTMFTREVPLSGMPEAETLWAVCIHTARNIDIRPTTDRETAEKEAELVNGWLSAARDMDDYDAKVAAGVITWTSAEVIEWPYSPSLHAEVLADQQRRNREDA